ncbi:MAG TPA: hypothetical protein VI306_07415 [Pyrinomonadaceae bacterium]
MNKLPQLCAATTLLFVLSLSALAGDIHTNVVDPPPPPAELVATAEPSLSSTNTATDSNGSNTLIANITLSFLHLLSVA